jgi:toxin ParE1/3/4
MPVLYAPRAETDLREIWIYTLQQWGEERADRYIRTIVALCHDIAGGHAKAVAVGQIRPGYFKRLTGSHAVYFKRTDADTILVIRILHQSMDFPRHL